MKPIYAAFDGFDVSFQCALPKWILDDLSEAKKEAQENRSDAIAKIGKNRVPVLVGETGSRGGFTYRFDTGFHGETWLVVDSQKREGWNVRVSVKSLTMALYGYEGVKEKILGFLINDLEAKGICQKTKDGEYTETPLERISRIDFCIDFKTDDFIPVAEDFVAEGRFKKKTIYSTEKIDDKNENQETVEIVFSGRNIKYIRVGVMPNRQIVLYDKISDITDKRKEYWWKIWGINKSEFQGKIWRLEARAGKKELNKWNLRRFSDFEKKAGDVISQILKDIRYTVPSITDKNITRWPMAGFWQEAINISREELKNHISDAQRKMIIEGHRRQLKTQFEKMILGSAVSYAALNGMEVEEIPGVLDILGEAMIQNIKENPAKYLKKHQDSVDKYAELEG